MRFVYKFQGFGKDLALKIIKKEKEKKKINIYYKERKRIKEEEKKKNIYIWANML